MVGYRAAAVGLAALVAAVLGAVGCTPVRQVATRAREAVAPGNLVTVDAQGRGDYTSIQAAVDAALPGTTVHVRSGVYHECVEVRKPLVLEGEGPDRTTIVSNTLWAGSVEEFVAKAQKAQAQGGEEGRAAFAALLNAYARPAVLVAGTEGVTLRGLKLTLLSPEGQGLSVADGVVMLDHAKAEVTGCIMAGAWAYGVKVSDGSGLTLSGSLVAAVVTSGVAVTGKEGMSGVEVKGTDFRRCGTGVQVMSNCPVTVEDCRFLQCDLAGLSYEQSAPVARHNAFVQSHQGITGQSDAGATIEGNVFCLSDGFAVNVGSASQTQIDQNTFASNAYGVAALKQPFDSSIRANTFTDNAVAVLLPEDVAAAQKVEGQMVKNLFWRNSMSIGRLVGSAETRTQTTLALALPAGNDTANPLFRDAPNLDYALLPGSPGLLQKAGAQDPLSTKSDWPEQPEETNMLRDETAPLASQGP